MSDSLSGRIAISKTQRTKMIAVLSAPSNLGLSPSLSGGEPGVREAPEALLKQPLLEVLCATDAGVVVPPPYDPAIDHNIGVRNAASLRSYTIELAERINCLLEQSYFPIVLGGDCSILLGSALALRRLGRYGLLFIDGHTDLLTPATSQTGGAAGMDLAMVTGTGPSELTSIDGLGPYLHHEDVVVCGFRWPAIEATSPAQPKAPMLSLPLASLRDQELATVIDRAINHFADQEFWVHVDADVLAPEWMPAVDSPDPGGMTPMELMAILKASLAMEHCVGLELTIYDPTLDHGSKGASLLVSVLKEAMTGA